LTFNQSVVLWCIVAPAMLALAAALVAGAIAWRFGRRSAGESLEETEASDRRTRAATLATQLIVVLSWWLGIVIAVSGREGWQWWPDEAWRRSVWTILAFGLVAGITEPKAWGDRPWRWVAVGGLASLVAYVALPSGEGWTDMLPLHRSWMLGITLSCLANVWSLDRLAAAEARRWLLCVALAGLAGPLLLASSSYGAVAEWTLAGIVATAVFTITGLLVPRLSVLAAAPPTLALLAVVTATGRFYTYEDHPAWSYLVILFLPAIVTLVDWPLRRRSTPLRVGIAAGVSLLLIALATWAIYFQQPAENW